MTHRAPPVGHHLMELVDAVRPLPSTVQRLASVVVDEYGGADDVATIVREDPELVTVLLSEANSASSAPATAISTVERAIVRLGLARVVAAATLAVIGPDASGALDAYRMPAGAFLDHALRASYVAEAVLGLAPDRVEPGTVTAALLHDIGKIVLDKVLDPTLMPQLDPDGSDPIDLVLIDVERELVSVDHAELGALILDRWSVPTAIVHAVRHHHRPDSVEDDGAAAVALSDILARLLATPDDHADPAPWTAVDHLVERLDLDRGAVVDRSQGLLARAGFPTGD